MKRIGLILGAGFLILALSGPATAGETIGVAPLFGFSKSVAGTYNTGQKSANILNPGTVFGLSFTRNITPHYQIEVQAFYTYLPFKKSARPNILREQVFLFPGIVFSNNLRWNLGPLTAYWPLGVGIYFWKYAVDGPRSDAVLYQGEKLEKMSPGFSTGLGLAFHLQKHFSLFAEARYHYVLCKDKFFFGENFSEQGVLLSLAGIRFSF